MVGRILLQSMPDGVAPWAILSVGVLAVIYLIMRKPGKRRDPLSSPLNLSLSQQRAVERDLNNLLVELSEMARRISAQLDNRATKLELLLQQADEKIQQMEALAQRSPSEPKALDDALPGRPANPTQRPVPPGPHPAVPDPHHPAPDPRHAEVYRLADQGHGARQIADQLGRPHGEIELILALRAK